MGNSRERRKAKREALRKAAKDKAKVGVVSSSPTAADSTPMQSQQQSSGPIQNSLAEEQRAAPTDAKSRIQAGAKAGAAVLVEAVLQQTGAPLWITAVTIAVFLVVAFCPWPKRKGILLLTGTCIVAWGIFAGHKIFVESRTSAVRDGLSIEINDKTSDNPLLHAFVVTNNSKFDIGRHTLACPIVYALSSNGAVLDQSVSQEPESRIELLAGDRESIQCLMPVHRFGVLPPPITCLDVYSRFEIPDDGIKKAFRWLGLNSKDKGFVWLAQQTNEPANKCKEIDEGNSKKTPAVKQE